MNLLNILHRTIQSCYLQQTLVLHYLRANIFYETHNSIYNRIYVLNVVESSCYKLGIYPLSYNFILGSFTIDELSFKLRKVRALVVQNQVARRSEIKQSNTKTIEKCCEKHIESLTWGLGGGLPKRWAASMSSRTRDGETLRWEFTRRSTLSSTVPMVCSGTPKIRMEPRRPCCSRSSYLTCRLVTSLRRMVISSSLAWICFLRESTSWLLWCRASWMGASIGLKIFWYCCTMVGSRRDSSRDSLKAVESLSFDVIAEDMEPDDLGRRRLSQLVMGWSVGDGQQERLSGQWFHTSKPWPRFHLSWWKHHGQPRHKAKHNQALKTTRIIKVQQYSCWF